ncbi:MAG: Crp/Fnr family transcriptional regulator [bacterium]
MVSPQILRRFPGFRQTLESSLRSVAVVSSEKHLEEGEVLFEEGEEADHLYLLVEGEVEIYMEVEGEHLVVDSCMPGDMCCWSALLEPPANATAGARARTACRLIAVEADDMKKLFARDCSMGFYLLTEAVRSLAHRLHGSHVQLAAHQKEA